MIDDDDQKRQEPTRGPRLFWSGGFESRERRSRLPIIGGGQRAPDGGSDPLARVIRELDASGGGTTKTMW